MVFGAELCKHQGRSATNRASSKVTACYLICVL